MKKRLRRLMKKLQKAANIIKLGFLYPQNEKLTEKLKRQFSTLEPLNFENVSGAEKAWNEFRQTLREDVATKDVNDFLNFDVIVHTMFCNANIAEYNYLKNHQTLPQSLLKEVPVGSPAPYDFDPKTSGNLVHMAYNFVKFLDTTAIDFSKIDRIVEFGGGYGRLAKLIRDYGYNGEYIIADLPEFSYLQQYYLNVNKHETCRDVDCQKSSCTMLLDDFKKLENIKNTDKNTLFIGCWSFSEVPVALREELLKSLERFNIQHYLIAYQSQFEDVNNVEYFRSFKENRNIDWSEEKIEHLSSKESQNYYLFGTKD